MSPERLLALYGNEGQHLPEEQERIICNAKSLSDGWNDMKPSDRTPLVRGIVKRVTVFRESLEIVFSNHGDARFERLWLLGPGLFLDQARSRTTSRK